jgi:hypothetical protein
MKSTLLVDRLFLRGSIAPERELRLKMKSTLLVDKALFDIFVRLTSAASVVHPLFFHELKNGRIGSTSGTLGTRARVCVSGSMVS